MNPTHTSSLEPGFQGEEINRPLPTKVSTLYTVNVTGEGQAGTYLLRIYLSQESRLAFGLFQGGKIFTMPPGNYIYIGSALSQRGSTSLAPRLLRHATRSGKRPAHPIREALLQPFRETHLGLERLVPPKTKKLHWNVDHLLDLLEADLTGVYVIRSPIRLEAEVGQFLMADPETEIVLPGLGANDVPGNTHILLIHGGEEWWNALLARFTGLLAARG